MRDPQPAKTGYFFGPCYQDIGNAIRESWYANARTAVEHYDEYHRAGLASFGGLYHLFCAISVVSFGTVFFILLSALILVVMSVGFVAAYIVFALVWMFDRAYLLKNKIFISCHECKSKFLIPIYICPKCGARHTRLTPGRYGIFHRTCNCGERLPCAFFNGRKKLEAICPVCLAERNQITILMDRESRPFCIPVVGGRSVGKTAYITAFSKLFVDTVAPSHGLDIELYNETTKRTYAEIETDFSSGSTRMTARPSDINQSSSIAFSFFIKNPKLQPERLMHIYDIAGEVFTDNAEHEVQKQYEYCQGILFIVDPFSIPAVRAKYGNQLSMEDRAGIGRADLNGVIDVFLDKLRQVTGLSDQKISQVPLAVVLGKTDSANLRDFFSEQRMDDLRAANPSVPLDRNDAIDGLCRQFLRDNQMEGFLNTISMRFANHRFFAASAIGHSRDHGAYAPNGILEPVEWICSLSDKDLYRFWGSTNFTKSPPKALNPVGEVS